MPIVGQFGSLAGFGVFPGAAFESIATVTLSSAASNIEFTSIPSGFQYLQVRLIGRTSNGTGVGELRLQFNTDTGSNYARHRLMGDGSGANAFAGASQTYMRAGCLAESTVLASTFAANVIDILDYASTSKNKTIRVLDGLDLNGSGEVEMNSGLWASTAAITSMRFTHGFGGNFVQHTTAALYGVRA